MTTIAHRHLPPSAEEAAIARVSGQRLSRYVGTKTPLKLRITESDQTEPIELPSAAIAPLMHVLEAMAAGRGITIILQNAELTTAQAAEVLNVSRPFLIRLLEQEKIPHRKVGRHRPVLMENVTNYKAAIDAEREAVLDRLAAAIVVVSVAKSLELLNGPAVDRAAGAAGLGDPFALEPGLLPHPLRARSP